MELNLTEILLVEDNSADAELTIRQLKKHNSALRLFHARDGEEALQFIFAEGPYKKRRDVSHQPKVILLDIQMPKVNGLEVLMRLKGDDRTKHIPVVVLTSSKESPDIDKSYALGANSYIVKPVNFENFSQVISNMGAYWLELNQSPGGC